MSSMSSVAWFSFECSTVTVQPDMEVQARLFDMIADSFVTLLHLMEESHKDEVFIVSVCVYKNNKLWLHGIIEWGGGLIS